MLGGDKSVFDQESSKFYEFYKTEFVEEDLEYEMIIFKDITDIVVKEYPSQL